MVCIKYSSSIPESTQARKPRDRMDKITTSRTLTFSILPVPPFRLDLTALALQRRPINTIDTWNGEIYSRVLMIDQVPVLLQVAQSRHTRSPRLHIKAQAHRMPSNARERITQLLELLLGLRIDMRAFHRLAK